MNEQVNEDPTQPHLVVRNAVKNFGGAQALKGVDLTVERHTVHALVGENGAGKSTLGKVVAGVHRLESGELILNGRSVSVRTPREGLALGVAMIGQELQLSPELTVMQNVFLGIESRTAGILRRGAMRERYRALAASTGFDLPPNQPVKSLRVAEQQIVEIMRALARDVRLIVMDEPTAALSRHQAERLFAVVRSLRDQGVTIIYVSHFLKEVLALADTITVMRDGSVVSTKPASEQTHDSLVQDMLGVPADVTFPPKVPLAADAPVAMTVRDLRREPFVNGVSFDVKRGEILGIAGLVGSGRTELLRLIFGADPHGHGRIEINDRSLLPSNPRQAMAQGIGLVPESRKDQGLVMGRSIIENVTLASLGSVSRGSIISRRVERQRAQAIVDSVDVRTASARLLVDALSGGNQQKVLFAKWLFRDPKVLLADEPTRGVDVGAKRAIYTLLHDLAARGTAVIVISSELEEVVGLANRVLVFRLGRVIAEFDGESVTEHDVLSAVFQTDGDEVDGADGAEDGASTQDRPTVGTV